MDSLGADVMALTGLGEAKIAVKTLTTCTSAPRLSIMVRADKV